MSRPRHIGRRLGVLAAAVCAACATEPTPEPATFEYPLDDTLRVHHIQAVGTHNSYHVQPASDAVPDWNYTHAPLAEQLDLGVRQFELDIYRNLAEDGFDVLHAPVLDARSTCPDLGTCLGELKDWSDSHPAHHPLMVLIEPKDSFDETEAEAVFDLLEGEILASWPRERIVAPADVRRDTESVAAGIAESGWPTLGETRGTAIFSLLDSRDHQRAYTHDRTSLEGRLMFANAGPDDPFAGVILMDGPVGAEATIASVASRGILVRTRADAGPEDRDPEDRTRRDAALASGAHAMSTDMPAPIAEGGYFFSIPGGTPSRCNPVTAPPECTAEAIEDPEFMP